MLNDYYKYVSEFIIILLLTVSVSCTTGKYVRTERTSEGDIKGVCTLILFSKTDPIAIAIFDIEGDGYTFEMEESKYNYTVNKSVPADQALKEAYEFLGSMRNKMSKILDDGGNIIGYDLRAIHNIAHYGYNDVLDVSYRIQDNRVLVGVDIKSTIRNRYYGDLFGGE